MQHGDVKNPIPTEIEKQRQAHSRILYPFGGVACLKEFIGLPGAFGCVPGSGFVASIATSDTEKLQLLQVAPEMAIARADREAEQHQENPCSKDW